MENQNDEILADRGPNSIFKKEESKFRLNASRAVEEFTSSSK